MGINFKSLLCFVFWINFTSNLQAQILPATFGFSNPSRVANSTIVSSGLVLHLDAGNASSYPGSGTTWTDLSGSGNNGTLVNGPTYSSANGGSLSFDGVNDYVSVSNTSQLRPSTELSIGMWIKANSITATWVTLFGQNP